LMSALLIIEITIEADEAPGGRIGTSTAGILSRISR
jgi:hypothetical protein